MSLPRLCGVAALVSVAASSANAGQVTVVGPRGQITASSGPSLTVPAMLGRSISRDLLETFSTLELDQGDVLTFSGVSNIRTLVVRVNGGPTSIDGTLRFDSLPSSFPTNLVLIDPAGITFGRDAQLQTNGSVALTTADYVRLIDGSKFIASASAKPPLLRARAGVAAFGFLHDHPAPISIASQNSGNGLAAPDRFAFSVVSGPVKIIGGRIQAHSGRVNLVAVDSTGVVKLDPQDPQTTVNIQNVALMAPVRLNHASIDVASSGDGNPGGSLVVNASDVSMKEASTIDATSYDLAGGLFQFSLSGDLKSTGLSSILNRAAGSGAGGGINIEAGNIILHNGQIKTSVSNQSTAVGGKIVVQSNNLQLTNGGQIFTFTHGPGRGGDIDVTASQSTVIDGTGAQRGTSIAAITIKQAPGSGGNVRVASPVISLIDTGEITATTKGFGNGGHIDVLCNDLLIDGKDNPLLTGLQSRAGTNAEAGATGGQINVNADDVNLLRGGVISASTFGPGTGGNINLTANQMQLTGDPSAQFTGLFARSTDTSMSGPMGVGGAGGTISAMVSGPLTISNGAAIATPTLGSGLAGQITVSAGTLSITNGGMIESSSVGRGDAGGLAITSSGFANLDGAVLSVSAPISNADGLFLHAGGPLTVSRSNISASAGHHAGGVQLGSMTSLHVLEGSSILAQSAGMGSGSTGGDIQLTTSGPLHVNGTSLISTSAVGEATGGSVLVQGSNVSIARSTLLSMTSGTGDAGVVRVITDGLINLTGGNISTSAQAANGGNIVIRSMNADVILNEETVSATASLDAELGGSNAGSIVLRSPDTVLLGNSSLSTNATGAGGNIYIDPSYAILRNTSVTANAINKAGGNIQILPDVFLESSDSTVTASSQKGIAGQIQTSTPDQDLAGTLVQLPGDLLSTQVTLAPICPTGNGTSASTFIITGHGGAPPAPGGWMPVIARPDGRSKYPDE